MDTLVNQLARELADAIAAAVADDARVEACREKARAAGLGYIANHFDAIDRQRTGAVSFDDVKRFLRARGAQLD